MRCGDGSPVVVRLLAVGALVATGRLRPEATKAALKRSQDWLLGHARQLMVYTALILGAYLALTGLVRLS